ncbi:hypothetical protein G5V58_01995 [Nocardioides anomalus]|uniref:Uncharacterized protein n=1 Tax=Nocardioides anomalus TaxID=2712223 RepID=A0A6G6W982_9ACTN|nr:hypothetical protein [Nocardioides anomalus]QIG41707.1 hypothetical protein G5V58_01995 [Nocardioides anomalus]
MNPTTAVHPEVAAFLDRVRRELLDLDEEQREELLDGLEADLSEQRAAGDPLPDPTAYAAELRAAAGLGAARAPRLRLRRPARSVADVLDEARDEWTSWTTRHEATRTAWTLVEALRPAWWVLRAWVAATLLDQLAGPWERVTLWPTLGVPLLGPVVLLAAVVISVLIGLGRLWPGSGPERSTAARLVLVGLNVVAVLLPLTFTLPTGHQDHTVYASPLHPAKAPDVLRHGREVVRNIYAYDAQGQPLQGVQLFDQEGRPVAVSPRSSMGRGQQREVTCPWLNGTTQLYNVFPLPQRTQKRGTCLRDLGQVGEPGFRPVPLASVPPVSPVSP